MKLNLVSFLSLVAVAPGVYSAPIETCLEQSQCISWEVNVLPPASSTCFPKDTQCVVQVCLTMNPYYEGCVKDCQEVSHMCDSADAAGCPYEEDTSNPLFDVGEYMQSCPAILGDGQDGGGTKCENISKITMCQQGVPGGEVHFIIKDGAGKTDPKAELVVDNVFLGGDGSSKCKPSIQCRNNYKTCGNKVNNENMLEMERVWTYTIPPAYAKECSVEKTCDKTAFPTRVPKERDQNCAGGHGEPHFRTWSNEHFEYHGQCDLMLAKDDNFADGLGLQVQVRTKLVRFWSYIKNAAIRIGDDILELEGSASPMMNEGQVNYWVNFQHRGELTTIGGFPVTMILSDKFQSKVRFEIDLSSKYPGQKIVLSTFKEFVAVNFKNSNRHAFGNTVGLLGQFGTGTTLARDGLTEMHDFMEYGREWQVLPSEDMLFHLTEDPQFPKQCIEPEDPRGERRRRLGEESITEEQAEAACAGLTDPLDRKDCVYDILATQDLDMVGAY